MSVRVLSARTRSERRSSAFPGSVINSCLMNLTQPRLIILGNSSTKGQKTIKSWRRAGILPSRHACEAIELMTLCFTPSLMSETQPGRGLEYRSVNVPTESSFSLSQKGLLGERLSEQAGGKKLVRMSLTTRRNKRESIVYLRSG